MATTDGDNARLITDTMDVSDIADVRFRTLIEAWYAQRSHGERLPHWEKIEPFIVPSLAAAVVLYEVTADLDLVFRIVGEDIKSTLRTNPEGKHPFDIIGQGPYGQFIVRQLQECAQTGLPVFSQHDFRFEQETTTRQATRIALPYGNAERVHRLLCYQIFSDELRLRTDKAGTVEDWNVIRLAFVRAHRQTPDT